MFPSEIPSMLPKQDIDFHIDLALGAKPISCVPYCMSTQELNEHCLQLDELLEKEHTPPSVSA